MKAVGMGVRGGLCLSSQLPLSVGRWCCSPAFGTWPDHLWCWENLLTEPHVEDRVRSSMQRSQAEAVNYLLSNYPKTISSVRKPLGRHDRRRCGSLRTHCCADSIRVGGGCVGLGMVFMSVNMGNDERLKKLEEKPVELEFVTTPLN